MQDLLTTRPEARKAKRRRYFPSGSCPLGHVAPHYVSGSPACMVCRATLERLLPADMPETAAEALAYGLETYFTGEPCKRGHVSPRDAHSRECLKCAGERFREPSRLRRLTTAARVQIHLDDIEELDAIAQALMWARFPQSSPYLARLGPKPIKRRNGIYAFRCHSKDVDTLRAFATALAAQRSTQPRSISCQPTATRTRVGPMPKLRPKCKIALRAHPDDVAELTAYAESLPKPKALK